MTFDDVMARFMFAMKMLLALSDHGTLDELKVAHEINEKMGKRLKAIIDIREEEENSSEKTLSELLDSFEKE